MSNIQSNAEADLLAFLRSHFGSSYPLMIADQAEREDWRVEVAKAERGDETALTPPWGVLHFLPAEPIAAGFGLNAQCFLQKVQIWHTEKLESGSAPRSVQDVQDAIAEILHNLRRALYANAWSRLTVLDEYTRVNISLDTPPNRYFLQGNLPYKAGVLEFAIMYGATDG